MSFEIAENCGAAADPTAAVSCDDLNQALGAGDIEFGPRGRRWNDLEVTREHRYACAACDRNATVIE